MKFKDLEPKVQERLLQENAEQLDYDWWDSTEADAKADGAERGFDIDSMHFSGFYSQGDGASWIGSIDMGKFLRYHLKPDNPQFTQYTVLRELDDNSRVGGNVSVTTSGNYSHRYTMSVSEMDISDFYDGGVLETGPMAGANVEELLLVVDPILDDFHTWIQDEARDFAYDYYKALEEEYEYLSGEESLIERDLDYDTEGEEIEDGEEIEEELGDAAQQMPLL